MTEDKPTCSPNGIYSVKRTCAELGVSHKTLQRYRESGYIKPLTPANLLRPKFSGIAIIRCWEILTKL